MPSLDPARIREEFTTQPNGDLGITITVIARRDGVEIITYPGGKKKGGYIGPRDQGWASAAEHFGRRLAKLCEADRKRREAS